MNLNFLTDDEFINWLHINGYPDEVVARLCKIKNINLSLVDDLVKVGYDKSVGEFVYEGAGFEPADYIARLLREIDYLNDEMSGLHNKIDELSKECKKLEARPIAELIAELHTAVAHSDHKASQYMREAQRSNDRAKAAYEMLDMWHIMKKEFV